MPLKEFTRFPKIARWKRDIIITEKIDGTNAKIYIEKVNLLTDIGVSRYNEVAPMVEAGEITQIELNQGDGKHFMFYLQAGSRERWLKPGKKTDNFGFADWVFGNAPDLWTLGPGEHDGEWWGAGIQRTYGRTMGDKSFSLFNVSRYSKSSIPSCCSVVPLMYSGPQAMQGGEDAVDFTMRRLRFGGSEAQPGYMNPEGLVIFHTAGGVPFKYTTGAEENGGGKERAA